MAQTNTKRSPGRPKLPKGVRRGLLFSFRLRPDEKKLIIDAASELGREPSEFVRGAILRRARAAMKKAPLSL